MAASTRSRVASLTAPVSLSTAETVALETPARVATSEIVDRVPGIAPGGARSAKLVRTGLNRLEPVQGGRCYGPDRGVSRKPRQRPSPEPHGAWRERAPPLVRTPLPRCGTGNAACFGRVRAPPADGILLDIAGARRY